MSENIGYVHLDSEDSFAEMFPDAYATIVEKAKELDFNMKDNHFSVTLGEEGDVHGEMYPRKARQAVMANIIAQARGGSVQVPSHDILYFSGKIPHGKSMVIDHARKATQG